MNTTHTPGPWQVETEDGSVRVATSDYVIAYAQVLPRIGEDLGNARLIAAAPDLLEALVNMLYGNKDQVQALKAIAKAEGRQP